MQVLSHEIDKIFNKTFFFKRIPSVAASVVVAAKQLNIQFITIGIYFCIISIFLRGSCVSQTSSLVHLFNIRGKRAKFQQNRLPYLPR